MTSGRSGQPAGTFTGTPAGPGSSSSGDARPGLSSGDLRQWRNTARELANDAGEFRRTMQSAGLTGKDLTSVDEVVKALRALDTDKVTNDPLGMQQLMATALDKMKKLEYDLRKRADTANEQLYISGSEDVPKAWEAIIQDYYRQLGKTKKGGGK